MSETDRRFDYIVVGAGSAGCVVASRLTEDPGVTVLVLEAGGRDNGLFLRMPMASRHYTSNPNFSWNYESEPEPFAANRKIVLPRGKTLGGSSSINGMLYVRGHARDYDQWQQMGLEGWGYADVLPYFKKSESSWRGETKFHGSTGPMAVTQQRHAQLLYEPLEAAAHAAGHSITDDPNGKNWEGIGRLDLTIKRGWRASTARAFLRPAMKRSNLAVETRALTCRVIVEHGRAVGIEYRQNGKLHRVFAEREVILSGGAYNSPQLLMLSGIGPADHLRAHGIAPLHDLPGVGKNLSEHPLCALQYALNTRGTLIESLRLDRATANVLRWMLTGSGLFASNGCMAMIFLRTREGLERPDVSLLCVATSTDAQLWFPGILPMKEPRCDVLLSLLHPDSRGEVTLRSGDPAQPPRILLNLCKEQADVDTLIRGIHVAREIYGAEPMKSLLGREVTPGADNTSDAALDQYIRNTSRITHHPVGTCSMGIGPEAVVDAALRVRGIEGLRVVDASVMPTEPGGNTNAPTIMIAEKAADMIRGRHLSPAQV